MEISAIAPIDPVLKSCLVEIFSRRPVLFAYLYGSAANGRTHPFSDFDLALVLAADDLQRLNRLEFELQIEDEIARRCEIGNADVRVINDAPLMVKGEVLTNGVLLYCQDDEGRVEFEVRTRMEYFDFLPTAEAIRQAYFERVKERGFNG